MGKKTGRRPFVEFLLWLINIVFSLCGLAIFGYGLFCFLKWKQSPPADSIKFMADHRLLFATDSLPKAWFIYLLIGIGGILFIISCLGYMGIALRSLYCLFVYCVLLVAYILAEIGLAALVLLYQHNCIEVIPKDSSGNFQLVQNFLNDHWRFKRWAVLAVIVLQVIAVILALCLRSAVKEAYYYELPPANVPRAARTPKSRRTTAAATTIPSPSAGDQRMPKKSPITTATRTATATATTTLPNASAGDQRMPIKSPITTATRTATATTTTTLPNASAGDQKMPTKVFTTNTPSTSNAHDQKIPRKST